MFYRVNVVVLKLTSELNRLEVQMNLLQHSTNALSVRIDGMKTELRLVIYFLYLYLASIFSILLSSCIMLYIF